MPYEIRSKLQQAAQQIDEEIRRGVAQFRNEIMREIEFLEDEVVTIGVGMPLMDTRRFMKLASEVSMPVGSGTIVAVIVAKLESNAEDVREGAGFMLSYLSRLIRLVNEAYPEIIATIEVPIPLTSQSCWMKLQAESTASGVN